MVGFSSVQFSSVQFSSVQLWGTPPGTCVPGTWLLVVGGGDGQFPIPLYRFRVKGFGSVSYQIRILLYCDVSCMCLECILMCPVDNLIYIQDTSRYIKIHPE